MSSRNSILVATDFGEASVEAARTALALAPVLGAELHAVNVIEQISGYENLRFPHDKPVTMLRPLVDSALENMARFAAGMLGGIPAERQHVRCGRPYEEVAHALKDSGATLLVLGTHGRTGFDRMTLGSVAERLLAHSPVPVLTVRKAPKLDASTRLVVATDFSNASRAAARFAASLAKALSAKVTVLGVLEAPAGRTFWKTQQAEAEAEAAARMKGALEELGRAELSGAIVEQVVVRVGTPAVEIPAAAKELGADILVMGTAGESGVKAWMLGGITERVLRTCTVPLLTARGVIG